MHPTNLIRLLVAAAALVATGAGAQAWPDKPIRIVVPYPPGGSSDIIARAISQPLGEALKQTVIVENKPGANGNTGSDFVAKSTDGHTLLLCDVGALAISPSVYKKLAFDPSKDLRGVTMLAYSPHLLVVHPSVPANNLKELVALSQTAKLDFAVTEECNHFAECDVYTAAYGDHVIVIEYLRADFDTGCAAFPGLSIVLRDRPLAPAGAPGHVFASC